MKSGLSLFAAGALVCGLTATSASATTFFEDAAFGVFPFPAGVQETNGATSAFSAVYDTYGRTVALAEPIADSTIDEISPRLWTNDADLWQINVIDSANFSAQVGGGHSLILFDASGNALAGVLGNGPSSFIDGSWLSGDGIYYLGLGADGSNPRNAAGENLFALSGTASAPVAGDIVLSSDPAVAWEKNNLPTGLVGPGNFTRPSATVRVHIPEPASLALLGLGGLAMLRRR